MNTTLTRRVMVAPYDCHDGNPACKVFGQNWNVECDPYFFNMRFAPFDLPENAEQGLVEATFFRLDDCPSPNDLIKEYEKRGLKPAPYAHMQALREDRSLVKEGTHRVFWKTPENDWHIADISEANGLTTARVDYFVPPPPPEWGIEKKPRWFCGIPA